MTFNLGFYGLLGTAFCWFTVELEIYCLARLYKLLKSACFCLWSPFRRRLKQKALSRQPQTDYTSQQVVTVSRITPTARVTSQATVRYETETASNPAINKAIWSRSSRYFFRLLNSQICIDFVTKLLNLNWNTDLAGVSRDARGLDQKPIIIRGIYHIDNKALWSDYVRAFSQSLSRYQLPQKLKVSPIATKSAQSILSSPDGVSLALQRCRLQDAEAFMFHGTTKKNVDSIVREGFNIRYAKRGAFGHPGIYLSENAQKADKYSTSRKRRSTGFYMFIVRVALGKTEIYENKNPTEKYDTIVGETTLGKAELCENKNSGEDYDRIVGRPSKMFREFVKTDTAQMYPEFLVHYDRLE